MGSHSGGGTATGGGGDPPSVIDIFVLLPGQRELKEGRRNDVFIGNSRRRKETAKSSLGRRGNPGVGRRLPYFMRWKIDLRRNWGEGDFARKCWERIFLPPFHKQQMQEEISLSPLLPSSSNPLPIGAAAALEGERERGCYARNTKLEDGSVDQERDFPPPSAVQSHPPSDTAQTFIP